MKRREFLAVIAGAAVSAGAAARAQQQRVPVIGILGAATPDDREVSRNLAAFRQGLAERGYVEGQNVGFEYRWAAGHYDRLPQLARELVRRGVDIIVNEGGAPSVLAAKNATTTIPIVFHSATDPVAGRLVASLARPGGNLTGVSVLIVDLSPKLLQIVAELVPQARVIALLANPTNPNTAPTIRQTQEAASAKGLEFVTAQASNVAEINSTFTSIAKSHAGTLVVAGDVFFTTRRDQLVALAERYKLPAIYTQRLFAVAGGLASYGPSLPDAYRLKGVYAGRILGGEKPADLPVQQPTKLELVINLTTAKALGLTVPQALLARADEVIE
jgi:putative ABC transport system substrate-binding protein